MTRSAREFFMGGEGYRYPPPPARAPALGPTPFEPVWQRPTLEHGPHGSYLDVPWEPKLIDLTELGDLAKPAAWSVYHTYLEREHPTAWGVGGEA